MNNTHAVDAGDAPITGSKSDGYSISVLPYGDESRWDDFVRTSEGGTFYHLAGWRSIIENRLHHPTYYLICELEGTVQAVLPLVHTKSLLFGSKLVSVPFLVYGGPLVTDIKAERQIVAYACELARELCVDYLELRNQCVLQTSIGSPQWHESDSHVTFRKRLDPDPAMNLAAIPRKQRAMIRKGEQAGLHFEMDDDAKRLYGAMLKCKRNLGTPFFGPKYLQAIKDEFGDQVQILTVLHGRDVVCSVMSFRYKNQILPYYGGGGVLARKLKGNDFMYWSVMEKASLEGIEIFDYGRSTVGSGAYRFKKHWGFEPEPLSYQYFLVRADTVPNLSPSNPRYHFWINAWKRLPLPLAGFLGPPIARVLG